MRVLVLNPGSSTLKASLVDTRADAATGSAAKATLEWPPAADDAEAVVGRALDAVGRTADAVGYRVVHGGPDYRGAAAIDDALLSAVEALDALAPLHNARAAAVMRAGRAVLPDLPQVACFDTAFHAGLPEEAWRYPLPMEWVERWGIRRFGFHGLSVAWSTRRAAELLRRPPGALGLVIAHLGSGCSVTAVENGRSVDTSMGFTPYEGLMMGTRAGSIDPGILLYLVDAGLGADDLADGLAHRSGLSAVGGTPDVRQLERNAAAGDRLASLALDMFARRAAAAIASAATALGRVDAIVFTGGIGEHAAGVRFAIVRRLAALGVPADLNDREADAILADDRPAVLAVRAREDRVIAEAVAATLADDPSARR